MASPPATPEGPLDPTACDVSVVLAAYNEARLLLSRVSRLARHLGRRGDRWEIVVVDEGSTDETAARVEGGRRRGGARVEGA